ncbi:hydroxyethylthiazole kinase [Vagococcus bubulae]|uniref:Hydroxyethylthiazole kinase n=1 Tax=Vagococcus bubulae TaxID=1977868 RepID=A0A429ZB80_9ENTE|nr:hydroxyethylthiazole kinase [Vagococcus bubulae]RST90933.1 hydroxyethylthiazole kinase [Vagococcus bubulae]
MLFTHKFQTPFPLLPSPLVHCITNSVTCETVANSVLYIGGKPIMTEDTRDFSDLYEQVGGVLINIGHLSEEKETAMILAIEEAKIRNVPIVVDNVGVSSSRIRKEVANRLLSLDPTVVKGNVSEMRTLCNLASHGKGVDAAEEDQNLSAMKELEEGLLALARKHPNTCFLATGPSDLVVYQSQVVLLQNGIEALDQFTGTGDVVGALIATLLGSGVDVLQSVLQAVSYFNLCGEKALEIVQNEAKIASIREETLNQLSLLKQNESWQNDIRGDWL